MAPHSIAPGSLRQGLGHSHRELRPYLKRPTLSFVPSAIPCSTVHGCKRLTSQVREGHMCVSPPTPPLAPISVEAQGRCLGRPDGARQDERRRLALPSPRTPRNTACPSSRIGTRRNGTPLPCGFPIVGRIPRPRGRLALHIADGDHAALTPARGIGRHSARRTLHQPGAFSM
jgi:hypothetical protein